MPETRMSIASIHRPWPPLRLLENLSCEISGLLFDLDFREDLAPYLSQHPRLRQIQGYPPLLIYADPRHCTSECLESQVRTSLNTYPQLAHSRWDGIRALMPQLTGPGYRKNADGTLERHRLVLFSSASPAVPLGFLWLKRTLAGSRVDQQVNLAFDLEMAYVRPEYRGLGYGTTLAVAAGMCCNWEIRYQAERYAELAITLAPRLETPGAHCADLIITMSAKIRTRIEEDREMALGSGPRILDLP